MLSLSSSAEIHTPKSVRPAPRVGVSWGVATHAGMARSNNEDAYATLLEAGLFIVADGMGGAAGGEVASTMAVGSVREAFAGTSATWPPDLAPSTARGPTFLSAAIQRANRHIHAKAKQTPNLAGMGSTIVALLVMPDRIAIAHVGDSRAYRLRAGRLDLLTEDHSLVNELIRRGLLSPDEHPPDDYAHVITRALGTEDTVDVELRVDALKLPVTYLLCSDGLTNVVSSDEIATILGGIPDAEQAAMALVDRANQLGGPDNITATIIHLEAADREAPGALLIEASEGRTPPGR